MIFYDDGKKLVGYKYLNTDFVKADKECSISQKGNMCDYHNGYCCFDCEQEQIRNEYLKVKYTDDCEWVIPKWKYWSGSKT